MNTCRTMAAVILAILYCAEARAQDIPRYQPRTPTTSPYLNLLRNDSGPLPNYYGLVRPQLNQRAFDNQMSKAARSQNLAIQRLSDVSGSSATAPTGSGSVFNNRSHFYKPNRSQSRR